MANLTFCPSCGLPCEADSANSSGGIQCKVCAPDGGTTPDTDSIGRESAGVREAAPPPPKAEKRHQPEATAPPPKKKKVAATAKAMPDAKSAQPVIAIQEQSHPTTKPSVKPQTEVIAAKPAPAKPAKAKPASSRSAAPTQQSIGPLSLVTETSKNASPTPIRQKKQSNPLPLILGAGGVAVVLLIGVLALAVATTNDDDVELAMDADLGETVATTSDDASSLRRPRISDEEAARRRARALALRAERDKQESSLGSREFPDLEADPIPDEVEQTKTTPPVKTTPLPKPKPPTTSKPKPNPPALPKPPIEPEPAAKPPTTTVGVEPMTPTAEPLPTEEPLPNAEGGDQIAKVDQPVAVNPEPPKANDGPREIKSPKDLEGATVTLLTQKGFLYENTEILEVDEGDEPGTFKFVKYAVDGKRPKTEPARSLAKVTVDDQPFEIRWDNQRKTCYLFDVKEHLAEVAVQLRQKGHMLWPKLDDEERQEYIHQEKKFLDKVGAAFGNRLRLKETKYFLVYTDIPDSQVDAFVTKLDEMYTQLSAAFGVAPGENIWRGKATVLAFLREEDYHRFEQLFMDNANSAGTAGLHHGFHNGRVLISVYRGDDPIFFAQVLVHETSHGFLHRYKSNVHIPSWINEGIADWVANMVVPQGKEIRLRQQMAVKRLRQAPTLGGNFFTAQNIEGWQYGVASTMTHRMLETNGAAYRSFIDGIKEGQPWPEALQASFSITPAELVASYGRSIGSPALRP